MFSYLRKVVAGPKNTLSHNGLQLDLTYITPRIIAMAFPAQTVIQKTYRNDIKKVAAYLQQQHPDSYLVVNVSSRKYNPEPFKNRVVEFAWADHQAPTLTTLVQIAQEICNFLIEDQRNVVAVHCNHGKGRTGTAIISFLLFVKYFVNAETSLQFYNKRRFSKVGYGVDQPCQLRYLKYLQSIVHAQRVEKKLPCLRLRKITHVGLTGGCFVRITSVRQQQVVVQKVGVNESKPIPNHMLIGDVLIQLMNQKSKRISRINFNLYFLGQNTQITFKSANIKVQEGITVGPFEFTLHFEYYCLCHLPIYHYTICACNYKRSMEECYWSKMLKMIDKAKDLNARQANLIVNGFGSEYEDYDSQDMQYEEMDNKQEGRVMGVNDPTVKIYGTSLQPNTNESQRMKQEPVDRKQDEILFKQNKQKKSPFVQNSLITLLDKQQNIDQNTPEKDLIKYQRRQCKVWSNSLQG